MGDHQSYKIECMGKKNEACELKEMTVFELNVPPGPLSGGEKYFLYFGSVGLLDLLF